MLIKNDFFSYKNCANLQLFLIKTKKSSILPLLYNFCIIFYVF